jgi:aarF domain-containing kinase
MKLQIFCVKFANSDSVYRFDALLILKAFWVRQMPTELSDCYGSGNENGESSERLQLVLLDFGLAEELPPQVRYHFISFIINIGAANGKRAAHHLLQFSWPHEQRCRRPDLLVNDMNELFKKECDLKIHPIDLNTVLKQVLQLCRKHEVTIDSSYASLVVAVCVLVGFARSLDPELSIMDAAIPCLFFYNLVGRIPGGIYG